MQALWIRKNLTFPSHGVRAYRPKRKLSANRLVDYRRTLRFEALRFKAFLKISGAAALHRVLSEAAHTTTTQKVIGMRFDLADLRLFLSVTESSSITQGANNAHVAPPSASERIRNMEHEIGTALLFRESRGVRPTPAGIALAHHARTILKQNEVMRGELSEYANGLRGRIRLLSNTAGLSEFLPDLLSDYLRTYQNIDLEIEERPSHEIIQAISCGAGDAGIVADIFPIGQLRSFPFVVDQLVLVVPAGHAFSELTGVEFSQALTQDFVGLMRHSALMDHLESHATRLSKTIRWRVRLSTFDAVCRLVEQGIGVAVVPERAAVRAQLNGNLVCIKLSDAWARRRLMICVRELDELPKHARQLVDHILSKSAN